MQACRINMNESISVEEQIPPLDYKLAVAIVTIIRCSLNIPGRLLQPSGIDRPKLEILYQEYK